MSIFKKAALGLTMAGLAFQATFGKINANAEENTSSNGRYKVSKEVKTESQQERADRLNKVMANAGVQLAGAKAQYDEIVPKLSQIVLMDEVAQNDAKVFINQNGKLVEYGTIKAGDTVKCFGFSYPNTKGGYSKTIASADTMRVVLGRQGSPDATLFTFKGNKGYAAICIQDPSTGKYIFAMANNLIIVKPEATAKTGAAPTLGNGSN